ncbi:ATP-binding response regulator [Vibrio spartinae]|uniref:histidine kinase n=1 Tax=Vibrio spartinae TaxID=1918945 RepID=A0A1N6M7H6_9VIBR|nr:hybrid sensor histidine kinase/response regulator [Vibrio spartinae]SIO95296.1 Autoinducer 1 sensor kinase/phosphatase LuxN [Vibrio spartinae]
MFESLIHHLIYPKALLLLSTAFFSLGWLIYFIRCSIQQSLGMLKTLYYPYVMYTFFITLWIMSNAYFHTEWLVDFGNSGAVFMAKAANIFSFLAFSSAFHFSCRLKSLNENHSIKYWQLALITISTIYAFYVNLTPGLTVVGVIVEAPSKFTIHFGSETPTFFFLLILFTFLTLFNTLGLSKSSDKLKRVKSTYMVIGIVIFMISTAVIHVFITTVFNDFSFTWLPPAFSIIELFLMGYAVIFHRFYSWKYLLHLSCSTLFALCVYIIPLWAFSQAFNILEYIPHLSAWCLLCGATFHYTWAKVAKWSSLLIYRDTETPVHKILSLSNDFQYSTQDAMYKLAQLLNLEKEQTILISDAQSNELYATYLIQDDSVLLLEEVKYHFNNTRNQRLNLIKEQMSKHNAAMILPLYDHHNTVSQLLFSPHKSNGSLYSNEEISALQKLFSKVQSYIRSEHHVKQAQAMAKSIAHEMRNPLSQILLHLENLDNIASHIDTASHFREEIQRGRDSIQHGNQMIDIILYEANQSIINNSNIEPYQISSLVDQAINIYAYESDDIKSRVHFYSDNDFIIKVNETLFGFIIFNLLKNSICYFNNHPDNKIEIRLETGDKQNKLLFKDYGPGIEPQIIQRIFDEFFTYQKKEGSGLGLSYCKRAMKLFGGQIECRSIYGNYTEFSLVFPYIEPLPSHTYSQNDFLQQLDLDLNESKTDHCNKISDNLTAAKILVTDDSQVQRSLVRLYLKKLGAEVYEAENGQQAIDVVSQKSIDIVFMDIQMPIMNGFEACRQIKAMYPNLPVIALSGESGEQEIRQIAQTMDDRLLKPTTQKLLKEILEKWIKKNELIENF